jgi:hypothetical protein
MSQKSLKVELSFYCFSLCTVQILIRALYAIFVRTKSMYLRTCKSFKSENDKKDWISKPEVRKVLDLRKVRKSNKLFMSANLRICRTYLRNRTHLVNTKRPPWGSGPRF